MNLKTLLLIIVNQIIFKKIIFLKAMVLKKFEFDKGSKGSVSDNQLNELKTRALSKFVVVVMFFVYIITSSIGNHMIFLVQFGINKHL